MSFNRVDNDVDNRVDKDVNNRVDNNVDNRVDKDGIKVGAKDALCIRDLLNAILTNQRFIANQLHIVEHKLGVLEKSLVKEQKINEDIASNCKKMGSHIDFIENVYSTARAPLNFVLDKMNYMLGNKQDRNAETLPQLKDVNDSVSGVGVSDSGVSDIEPQTQSKLYPTIYMDNVGDGNGIGIGFEFGNDKDNVNILNHTHETND
jgi:hypothetical protein